MSPMDLLRVYPNRHSDWFPPPPPPALLLLPPPPISAGSCALLLFRVFLPQLEGQAISITNTNLLWLPSYGASSLFLSRPQALLWPGAFAAAHLQIQPNEINFISSHHCSNYPYLSDCFTSTHPSLPTFTPAVLRCMLPVTRGSATSAAPRRAGAALAPPRFLTEPSRLCHHDPFCLLSASCPYACLISYLHIAHRFSSKIGAGAGPEIITDSQGEPPSPSPPCTRNRCHIVHRITLRQRWRWAPNCFLKRFSCLWRRVLCSTTGPTRSRRQRRQLRSRSGATSE